VQRFRPVHRNEIDNKDADAVQEKKMDESAAADEDEYQPQNEQYSGK